MSISLLRPVQAADVLEEGFTDPPRDARLRAYWWWLNGNVTAEALTRDLEEMAAKGFGGALICDAGGAEQDGNDRVPHGPTFFSAEWRELYRHTLREADRLGLEMSLNIQSGWNLGGPMVPAEDAPKRLVFSATRATGPGPFNQLLEQPKHPAEFYRDLAVVAYPVKPGVKREPIQHWQEKALERALHSSAPDTSHLLVDRPASPGEEDLHSKELVDIAARMTDDGRLTWDVPPGEWEILRVGCTLNQHCRVSTCSDGWKGYALDPFDAGAFARYWDAVVEPLIADAGPLAGRTLKYLHTDSWEVEVANWTPSLREEFRRRRGYDFWPFLPALAGRMVDSRDTTNRFLFDFRKTMGELAVDNHYKPFLANARRHGLLLHPESGGPHAVPVDSLRCLGMNDAPMSEFWAGSWRHRVRDEQRFFVKQPASAAHTYGRRLVLAEGFTTIGPHWQETLWDNLKPSFDRASCEGLNLVVWHAFVCSPAEMGLPGQQYFAGTHLNPNITWWPMAGAMFTYFNRCQFLLQQGLFVADVVYYYGDNVPNFAQLKSSDPGRVLPGYDYDVATEEVVLDRMSVQDGRIILPDGMSYRMLVLPDRRAISLPVLRKLEQLVGAGATVLGPKPESATGLQGFPASDSEVAVLAEKLWADCDGRSITEHAYGAGRVIWGRPAREVLQELAVPPDVEFLCKDVAATSPTDGPPPVVLDYIHRRTHQADIYFVCNRTDRAVMADAIFRVQGKCPELWDAVTGERRLLPSYDSIGAGTSSGSPPTPERTRVPLEFAPYGSCFIVFQKATPSPADGPPAGNFPVLSVAAEMAGPWTVRFDPDWGGPASIELAELASWSQHPLEGIRFYSGKAVYLKTFDRPASLPDQPATRVYLDLGNLREMAAVRLNGRDLGVLWAQPFRVEVTDALLPAGNRLEIEVANSWANRVIGDASLPAGQGRTRTNIRKLTAKTPLMESGLLGPVTLRTARPQ